MSQAVKAIVDAILSGDSATKILARVDELKDEEMKTLLLNLRAIRDEVASNCIEPALEIDVLLAVHPPWR